MKEARIVTVALISLFVTGCADLTVKKLCVHWSDKTAMAEIANIGMADAGPFMVYFNAEENPVSQQDRSGTQVTHKVPGLAKGTSVTLEAKFEPHPANQNLANVYKIVVVADAKGMVKESNENNNSAESNLIP